MNFLKYPSLVNHYAIGKSRRVVALYEQDWLETEKIHGANISIVVDKNGSVDYAKRSGFITMDDKQFNRFVAKVDGDTELYDQLSKFLAWDEVTQVHAFGEYFGGSVQKMDYDLCKQGEVDVKLFNVILEYADGLVHYVVSRDELEKAVDGKYLAEVTGRKTLKEFVGGYPKVDSAYGGVSEGSVYQPTFGYILNDGNGFLGVKYKTSEFAEVSKQKVAVKPKVEYSPEFLALIEDVGRYVTGNRLDNVLSHGDFVLEPKSIGAIMIEFKNDVVKEYLGETGASYSEADVLSAVSKHNSTVAKLIKEAIAEDSKKNLS